MLNKIFSKFENFRKDISEIKRNQRDIAIESENIFAYHQLGNMFESEIFLPLTKWSLSPKQVLHICNDICLNNRKTIVEFGLGFSSICIAQLLKVNKLETQYYCIENNPAWVEKIKRIINVLQLENNITICEVPITDVPINLAYKNQQTWYDPQILTDKIGDIHNIDLIVVDAPFASNLPFARFSAIPYLKEKIALNYSVFLDDTNRMPEREIATEWQKILNCEITIFSDYTCLTSHKEFEILPF